MGVTALIVLTIIALGHIYHSYTNIHKYNLLNKPVHIAYYNNAIVGSICFFFSFLIFIGLWGVCKIFQKENFVFSLINVFFIYKNFYYHTPKLTSIWLFSTVIALPMIFLYVKLKNYKINKKIENKLKELNKESEEPKEKIEISEYQIYEETLSDPLDRLISNSAYEKEAQYLLFTMKDKKVYVGKVKTDPELFDRFSEGLFNFLIEPQYSGYRDKDTLEVVLTTSYVTRSASIYEIVLDRKEILSAVRVNLPDLVKFLKNKNQFSDLIYEAWATGMPILIINKDNIGFVAKISEDLNLNGNVAYQFEFLKIQVIYQIVFKDDNTIESYLDFSEGKDFSIFLRIDDIKFIYSINKLEKIWEKDGNLNPMYWLNIANFRCIKNK